MEPVTAPVAPVEAAPPPPPQAASELPFKLSGKMYFDATYVRNRDDASGIRTKSRGVDVKRFYAGVEYTQNDKISAMFQTDIGDQNGKYDVFVKKAYIQAKLSPELTLRAGSADTTWVPFVEDRYGYRYLETVLIDRTKYGTSADWGLHALGRVANDVVGYQLSIVNGGGYANPGRPKWPSVEARVDAKLAEKLTIAAGAAVSTLGAKATVDHTGSRFNGLVAWNDKLFRAGVEVFMARNFTADQLSGAKPEDTARGVSAYANYRFVPTVGLLGRVDIVQPVADTDSDIKDLYFNVGVDYQPYKFLNLALVYKHEVVDTGAASFTFNTTNGKIGSATANDSGTYQEVGVFSQLTF